MQPKMKVEVNMLVATRNFAQRISILAVPQRYWCKGNTLVSVSD